MEAGQLRAFPQSPVIDVEAEPTALPVPLT